MLRLFVAVLFLTVAATSVGHAQPAPAAGAAQSLAEEKARADKAEQALAIEQAADRIEDAQTEQAYNRFEIWTGGLMGGFSLMVTVLILWFGFRTEKAAATAAAMAAAEEAKAQIAGVHQEIEMLRTNAEQASVAAKEAAQNAATEVAKIVENAKIAAENAAQTVIHRERSSTAAAIIDELRSKATDAGRDGPKLTVEQERIVKAAARGAEDTPEAEWSVAEYKTRIGKAQYLDEDWRETLRLAGLMAQHYGTDDEAYAFARNAEGDALHALGRYPEAILAYDATNSRLGTAPKVKLEPLMAWALYHKGVCLTNSGNPAEAEAELLTLLSLREHKDGVEHPNTLTTRHELARAIFGQGRAAETEVELRKLLPIRERIEGMEHPNTLTTRHELARAMLDQGRAAEAEAEFRALLPLCERIEGIENPSTLVTRYWFAAAVLENGNAAHAKILLDPIPYLPANSDWLERWLAELAFIRGKVADALDERAEADEWLEKAATHYAAVYPADHYYRRQFDAYLAARPGA